MKNVALKLNNEASIELAVMNILIGEEQRLIIPAFTDKSVQSKDLSKAGIAIDENDLLPSLFCFADISPYREQGVTLFDANGTEIPQELPQEAPQVLSYLDTPDTVNLIRLVEKPVRAEIIHIDSVKDAERRIALSNYVAKPMTKTNWRKLEVGASNTLQEIMTFATEHKLSAKTAQCYFGVNPSVSCLQKTAILGEDAIAEGNPLNTECAEKLYQTVADKFGARFAKQTRYIKVVSACVGDIGADVVISKLQALSEEAVNEIKEAPIDVLQIKIAKFLLNKEEQAV